MSIDALLRQTAEVRHASASRSDTGEVKLSWLDPVEVRCRLEPATGDSRQAEQARALGVDCIGYFPAGTDLRPGVAGGLADKVTVDGVDYLVRFASPAEAGARLGAVVVALLRRDA